ncbi:MAG TPA: hypothetical protein VLB80_01720 [Candidatus Babeliales bacterium]|nr:hypothetical protein [Candidatus Babeliales bacterium]
MKKLFIISLFFATIPTYTMQPKEKFLIGTYFTLLTSYFIYEFCIKTPEVRDQEYQKRLQHVGEANVRIGLASLQPTLTLITDKTHINKNPQSR